MSHSDSASAWMDRSSEANFPIYITTICTSWNQRGPAKPMSFWPHAVPRPSIDDRMSVAIPLFDVRDQHRYCPRIRY